MAGFSEVREVARQCLSGNQPCGAIDSLWHCCQRLAYNVEYICSLDEVAKGNIAIDRECLIAASYFNCIGLIRINAIETPWDIDTRSEDLIYHSTSIFMEKAQDIFDKAKINKVNAIITESYDTFTDIVEAMILSDARNLDQLGLIGTLREFRRNILNGTDMYQLLKNWERKKAYSYWQARLQDSFRFDSVRRLAEKRLEKVEWFMNALKQEVESRDLKEAAEASSLT